MSHQSLTKKKVPDKKKRVRYFFLNIASRVSDRTAVF
nr:MAG TPA: hypothetical protein [Caudoviricetes sp.]